MANVEPIEYYEEAEEAGFVPRDDIKYTYADYFAWDLPPRVRYELYHGTAYLMAAPNIAHQTILLNIGTIFHTFLEGKKCRTFVAPLDVRLFPREDKRDHTVVQPDVIIVCDPQKISKQTCDGAPDLIIEILSPSTRRHDLLFKLNLYFEVGVREYWIIDPEIRIVQQYTASEGGYLCRTYGEGSIPVHLFSGELSLSADEIFAGVE